MNDIIADLITRIRNGQMARRKEIFVLKSKKSMLFLDLLKKEGYIRGYKIKEEFPNYLIVLLKYYGKVPVIKRIVKISTGGRRVYIKLDVLWRVNQGFGCLVLSTTKGFITDENARKFRLGGEVLVYIE